MKIIIIIQSKLVFQVVKSSPSLETKFYSCFRNAIAAVCVFINWAEAWL